MLDAQQYFYYYSSKALQVSAGFVVAIHNQSEVPQVDSLGVGVAPGTDVRIGLKRKEVFLKALYKLVLLCHPGVLSLLWPSANTELTP